LSEMFLRFFCFCLFLPLSNVLYAQDKPAETKPPEKINKRPLADPAPSPEPFDNSTVNELTKCVVLQTAKGDIEIEMFPFIAPNTVRNFLNLSAIGAFENTTFSRVVPDFVIQGGNLYTNKNITYEMSVRAHKKLSDEPNQIKHERGIVSMAKGDEPNSASTSFFILLRTASSLDNNFAAFGKVVKGMDVVDLINKMPVDDETPKEPVVISKVLIRTCDKIPPEELAKENTPAAAVKVNNLPRFGLRGRVKSVRESTFELKGKKKDWREEDRVLKSTIHTEFGDIGDFLKSTYFNPDGSVDLVNVNEPSTLGSAVGSTAKDIMKDREGNIVSQAELTRTAEDTFTYEFADRQIKPKVRGTIKTNEFGRPLEDTRQEFDESGKLTLTLTTTTTYDAYGFMTSRIQVDGSGKKVFYNRYEYPELDDRANWTVRLVFDAEDSEKPVQIVKRVFEYYEEK
ncbi:MAG: peptidylprolyl isomerase, partial [Acidobacteriota bacterium]|nr:peptidylprolyl isomerase [Acidobacteriota bacterium]